jgi:hypothetical protein
MPLISQPGSDYQAAQVTLDAGHARDITLMLVDVHAVLDHLYLDVAPAPRPPARPETTCANPPALTPCPPSSRHSAK